MGRKKHKRTRVPSGPSISVIETIPRSIKLWMMGALVCVGFFLYRHTLHAPFILDDHHKIEVNTDLRIEHLSDAFSRLIYPYSENNTFDRNDPSRPVTFLSYTLNYYFGQLNPFGYRLVNLFGHIGVSLLLFALSLRLFFLVFGRDQAVRAFFLSLLFLTHPVNTGVALYAFNRSDILMGLFTLGSMLLFLGSAPADRSRRWGALALFVLALGSKQSAAVFPLLLLAADFLLAYDGDLNRFRPRWRLHLPFWVVLGIYLIARAWYFGGMGDLEAEFPITAGDYRISQIYSVVRYLQMAVVPWGMSLDHMPRIFTTFFDPVILGCVGLLALGAYWVWRKAHQQTPRARGAVFAVTWFLLLLAPTSSFFPTTALFADNRLYLPMIGVLFLIVLGYGAVFRVDEKAPFQTNGRALMLGVMAIHVGLFGYLAHKRGSLYNDPVALWKDVLRQYPSQSRACYSLGLLYYGQKDLDTALDYYGKAVQYDPHYAMAYNNMGLIYGQRFETEKAIEYFSKSLEAAPRRGLTLANLGRAYLNLKKYPEAIEPLQKAVEINPHYAIAQTLLGRVYLEQGDLARAREHLSVAVQDGASAPETQTQWGLLLVEENKVEEAVASFQKALDLSPQHAEAQYNLARVYSKWGRAKESQEWYQKACSNDPQYIFKPIAGVGGGFSGGMNALSPEMERVLQQWMKKGN